MFVLQGHTAKVGDSCLCFSPDGALLASSAEDTTIKLWDLSARAERATLSGHGQLPTGVAFIEDGKALLSCSWDRTLRFWDVAKGKQTDCLDTGCSINFMALSPDLQVVAAAGGSGWTDEESIQRWDVPGRKRLPDIGKHEGQIGALCFSPDGALLASGSADSTTRVWDLASGEQKAVRKRRAWIRAALFLPDSQTLVIAAGRTVTLWVVGEKKDRKSLGKHGQQVASVALSPDGKLLLTGCEDGAARLWDVASGELRALFRWKIGPIYAVAFAPDGMTAAAGGRQDIVVWDLDA